MTTKVQTSAPWNANDTFAHFQSWAGDVTASPGTGTGIAAALFTLGFVKQADQYTANWTVGAGIGATALPTVNGSLRNATTFSSVTADQRNPVAGSHFKGAYAGGTTYVAGDVVTYATTGLVYIATAGGTGNAPTNTSFWSPYWMEIWATNSGTLTNFYIKFEYGGDTTVANCQATMQIGTTYTPNSGVIGGNTSIGAELLCYGSANNVVSGWESSFCGDGQNYFVCLLWRSGTAFSSSFGFERSIAGTIAGAPVYTSSYVTHVKGHYSNTWYQNTVFLSGGTAASIRRTNACTLANADNITLIVNSITPSYPVFPIPGWVGNPLTIYVGFGGIDCGEGTSVTCSVYGVTTTYLQSKLGGLGASIGGGSAYGMGIKFQ